MAQDVISTLFNTTPRNAGWNQYMQDNMIDVNKAGSQYSDLGRANIERANAMMQNAGTGLGIGVARLLGGQTPQMAQEQQVQGLLGGASFQDPDQLMLASERFAQAGDIPRAQALAGQAQELRSAMATQQKSQFEMETKQRAVQNRYRALKSKFPEMSEAEAEALAMDEVAFREFFKESKIKYSSDVEEISAELYGKPFSNLTPAEAKQVNALKEQRGVKKASAGASKIVNVSGTAENEYAKSVGKGVAERDLTYLDTTTATAKTLPKIEETLKLINSGQINTGLAKDMQDGIAKVRAQVLKDKAAGKNVSDSQYLDSLLGSDTFAQIPLLGLGAKGMDTPAERDFILSVITGQRNLSLDTLRRMTEFRRDAAVRQVGDFNQRLSSGEFNQYQSTTGRTLKPIEVPGAPKTNVFPNAPAVGTIKNGYRYNGGDPAQPTSWSKK